MRSYKNRLFYVFGGFNSTKLLQNINLRVGVGHVNDNLHTEHRLKVTLEADKNNYHWYHKTFLAHKKARFGLLTVVDLHRGIFQKNNLLFGWHFNDNTSAYLRAEVAGFRGHNPSFNHLDSAFDTLTADVIHKINSKSKAAFETTVSVRERKVDEAKAVYQFDYEANKTVKVSLNNHLNFALSFKTPLYGLEDTTTLTAGLSVSGVAEKEPKLKSGFELNVNI